VTYKFDVTRGSKDLVSPLECIPDDQEFVPLVLIPGLTIEPNASAVRSQELSFVLTATCTGKLTLNFRPIGDEETVVFPNGPKDEEEDHGGHPPGIPVKYAFTVPRAGNYRLLMFVDGKESPQQYWMLGLGSRKVDWVVLEPKEAMPALVVEPEPPKPPPEETKKDSRCCLLV
jgi:hypothetical protein